jgi:hypothetical protein
MHNNLKTTPMIIGQAMSFSTWWSLTRLLFFVSTGLHLVNKPSPNNHETAGTVLESDLLESHRDSAAICLPDMPPKDERLHSPKIC